MVGDRQVILGLGLIIVLVLSGSIIFSPIKTVIAQVNVTPWQGELDKSIQSYYNALQDLRNCDINSAIQEAKYQQEVAVEIQTNFRQVDQGNIVMNFANAIMKGSDYISKGTGYQFPNPQGGQYIVVNGCTFSSNSIAPTTGSVQPSNITPSPFSIYATVMAIILVLGGVGLAINKYKPKSGGG